MRKYTFSNSTIKKYVPCVIAYLPSTRYVHHTYVSPYWGAGGGGGTVAGAVAALGFLLGQGLWQGLGLRQGLEHGHGHVQPTTPTYIPPDIFP